MEYTLESIGRALDAHIAREQELANDVALINKKLILGNGEPPVIEQVHTLNRWMGDVIRLFWIIAAAVIGELILGVVAAAIFLIVLANATGGG